MRTEKIGLKDFLCARNVPIHIHCSSIINYSCFDRVLWLETFIFSRALTKVEIRLCTLISNTTTCFKQYLFCCIPPRAIRSQNLPQLVFHPIVSQPSDLILCTSCGFYKPLAQYHETSNGERYQPCTDCGPVRSLYKRRRFATNNASYADMCTINGVLHPTFQAAAAAHSLLLHDNN